MPAFPLMAFSRHRLGTDGPGVTTLACAWGCPLRCRLCLNPQCFLTDAPQRTYGLRELLDEVRIDDLYFQATGGGIVFGGGEPLLQAPFIHAFCEACPDEWRIGLESSLAVEQEALAQVVGDIDFYLIDIKDMNPAIYRAYTGRDNAPVLRNLAFLRSQTDPEKVRIRVPLIEGFNTEADREASVAQLRQMGFVHFDLFTYDCKTPQERLQTKSSGTEHKTTG